MEKCVKALPLHIFFCKYFAICTKKYEKSSSHKAKCCDTVRNIDDRNEDMGNKCKRFKQKGGRERK